jgi:hypothetical protein
MADILVSLEALEYKRRPKGTNRKALQPLSKARSRSVGDDSGVRRVSFADPPRPSASARRIWISTKTDSGFVYDARLKQYGVSEKEWEQFSNEVIEAANIPGPCNMVLP